MNVAIFGDSWSCHSYKKLDNFKEAVGTLNFQNMFAGAGIRATNYSVHSLSNRDILQQVKKISLDQYDCAIVFQTDPLRNVVDRKGFTFSNQYSAHTTIAGISEAILKEFYQELTNIQKPILLVGGLSCIAHHLVPLSIHTLDKSWTELADPSFKDCYYEWYDYTELVRDRLQYTDDLAEIKKQIQSKNYVWQNSDAFGWCHPSDLGYEIMFSALQEKLNGLV